MDFVQHAMCTFTNFLLRKTTTVSCHPFSLQTDSVYVQIPWGHMFKLAAKFYEKRDLLCKLIGPVAHPISTFICILLKTRNKNLRPKHKGPFLQTLHFFCMNVPKVCTDILIFLRIDLFMALHKDFSGIVISENRKL